MRCLTADASAFNRSGIGLGRGSGGVGSANARTRALPRAAHRTSVGSTASTTSVQETA